MKIPDFEEEIAEKCRLMEFTCKNCGFTWTKHKMATKKWSRGLYCPPSVGKPRTFFRSMVDE